MRQKIIIIITPDYKSLHRTGIEDLNQTQKATGLLTASKYFNSGDFLCPWTLQIWILFRRKASNNIMTQQIGFLGKFKDWGYARVLNNRNNCPITVREQSPVIIQESKEIRYLFLFFIEAGMMDKKKKSLLRSCSGRQFYYL